MDWNIRMQGVRAEPRDTAGLVERTLALPIITYIKSKDGNADLRFRLVMNESQFENMSSLDASALWDILLQSMTKTAKDADGVSGLDKAIDDIKGLFGRGKKPPSSE
jgi:hypothetical protein